MHSPRRERKMVVASGHAEYNAEYRSEYHDEYHGGNHDEYHTEYWAEYRGEYHGEYHGGLWACCPLLPSQLTYFRFLRSLMIHTMMAVLLLLRKIKDLHMETKFSHHTIPIFCFFGMNSISFSSFTSYHYLTMVMMAMIVWQWRWKDVEAWQLLCLTHFPDPEAPTLLFGIIIAIGTFTICVIIITVTSLMYMFHQRKTFSWEGFFQEEKFNGIMFSVKQCPSPCLIGILDSLPKIPRKPWSGLKFQTKDSSAAAFPGICT